MKQLNNVFIFREQLDMNLLILSVAYESDYWLERAGRRRVEGGGEDWIVFNPFSRQNLSKHIKRPINNCKSNSFIPE